MLSRLGLGFVVLVAVVAAACGRQVTPNPPGFGAGGALPGQMVVFFDVAGTFNFSNYQYWIVFNTSGNGLTPGTQPFINNWAAYSSALQVIGNGAATSARVGQFVKNSNPHIPPQFVPLITTPQQLTYNANSNGTGTEFSIIFQRSIFTSIVSPAPSPTPLSNTWTFNAFTTQANVQNQMIFVDSMGVGGPNNPQYLSPSLNVTTSFDQTLYALSSGLQMDPAAQIISIQIGNNP